MKTPFYLKSKEEIIQLIKEIQPGLTKLGLIEYVWLGNGKIESRLSKKYQEMPKEEVIKLVGKKVYDSLTLN